MAEDVQPGVGRIGGALADDRQGLAGREGSRSTIAANSGSASRLVAAASFWAEKRSRIAA
jgi:hypothetical protein